MTTSSPLLTVVTSVSGQSADALERTIDSVLSQGFEDWEYVLVGGASRDSAVARLLRATADADPRVGVLEGPRDGGAVGASNEAIRAAKGRFVAFLEHGDRLAPEALTRVADVLDRFDDVDYLYTDEDEVDVAGHHDGVFSKPDWSPERLRSQMYTGHLSVVRTGLVRAVGGFRDGFDGARDHDLVLRVTERARRVVHVPEVLCHRAAVDEPVADELGVGPDAWTAGLRAVDEHLRRSGVVGKAELGPVPGTYRIKRDVPAWRVSAVIPTRGSVGMVWGEYRYFVVEAVRSLVERSGIPDLEVVVVYDLDTPQRVLDLLGDIAGERLVLVPFAAPFNFSAKCNLGAIHASGDVLLFLNDDTEIPAGSSLLPLIGPLLEPDVGMTGARLLFEDGRLQHGGHIYAEHGWYHACLAAGPDEVGPFNALLVARETSGLTAACAATRRATFFEVGGFSEKLPVNFNDVDLCYKLRSVGYRLLWLPDACAFHFESQTRVPHVLQAEVDVVRGRWGARGGDPYFPQDAPG